MCIRDSFPTVKERLSKIGFEHEGNLGVEGREAFKRTFTDDFMPYHMYVCPKDGKGHLEHIAFLKYLRHHPDAVYAYGKLKLELAERYRTCLLYTSILLIWKAALLRQLTTALDLTTA